VAKNNWCGFKVCIRWFCSSVSTGGLALRLPVPASLLANRRSNLALACRRDSCSSNTCVSRVCTSRSFNTCCCLPVSAAALAQSRSSMAEPRRACRSWISERKPSIQAALAERLVACVSTSCCSSLARAKASNACSRCRCGRRISKSWSLACNPDSLAICMSSLRSAASRTISAVSSAWPSVHSRSASTSDAAAQHDASKALSRSCSPKIIILCSITSVAASRASNVADPASSMWISILPAA